MSVKVKIKCPCCGSSSLWKFGYERKTKLQKYRCRNCKKQFVPGRPLRTCQHYPTVFCPRCGARMTIFKQLSDGYRYRCRNYNLAGAKKCSHKINVDFSGQRNFKTILHPTEIELVAGKIDPAFHWSKMKFPKPTVALALYYSICEAMPATQVSRTLANIHAVSISHDTITRWSHKAGFLFSQKTAVELSLPLKQGRRPRLYADETEVSVGGRKTWFWMSYCKKYDLMLGRNLTRRRDTKSARDLLAMTHTLAPDLKASELLTDGLWSYPSALGDLNFNDEKHIVYKSFFESPNNNALERKWSGFKNRAKSFRGFKSDVGQMAFIEGQVFYHHLLKPSVRLNGKTPFENLGHNLSKNNLSQLEIINFFLNT